MDRTKEHKINIPRVRKNPAIGILPISSGCDSACTFCSVKFIKGAHVSYHPEKIILFGSYAYGKPTENSDVDLVIIKNTTESFLERQKSARSLLRTTTPVDIFVFTSSEFEKAKDNNLLIKEIAELGKVIYE